MKSIKQKYAINFLISILTLLIVIYLIIRAFTVGVTLDEAYSFSIAKHFWHVEALCTGNTHWLNFLAIKTAILLGLEKAYQLRWFSILSSIVFLIITYKWILNIENSTLKFFAFGFLLLNPYLLDYFVLARGYSGALMLEVLCILYYYMYCNNTLKTYFGYIALFFAGMSAVANYNFFYFFTAFAFIYFINNYLKYGTHLFKNKLFYIETVFTIGIALFVLRALKFINECGNDIMGYGGEDLIHSIFYSFVNCFLNNNYKIQPNILLYLAYFLFTCVLFFSIYGIIRYKKHKNKWYQLSSILFALMIFLCVFNKWCLGVLYPTERTTLMFFPLIAMILVGFIMNLKKYKHVFDVCIILINIIILYNFIISMNLKSARDSFSQTNCADAFRYTQKLGAKNVGISPELYGVYVNYYQETSNYKYNFKGSGINTYYDNGDRHFFNNVLEDFDYLILYPPYNLSMYKPKNIKFKTVSFFKETRTIIVKVLKK